MWLTCMYLIWSMQKYKKPISVTHSLWQHSLKRIQYRDRNVGDCIKNRLLLKGREERGCPRKQNTAEDTEKLFSLPLIWHCLPAGHPSCGTIRFGRGPWGHFVPSSLIQKGFWSCSGCRQGVKRWNASSSIVTAFTSPVARLGFGPQAPSTRPCVLGF